MTALRVAVVSGDPNIRLEAARAFDSAPADWLVTLHTTVPEDADVVVLGPDAKGDGIPFDPFHPERVVDEIQSRCASSNGAVLAVSAASGGVGTTSVALHLAAVLAPACSVGYLDLSEGGAGPRLGLMPDEHLTWADLDDDAESITRCALPLEAGFRALLAPQGGDDAGLVLKRAAEAFDLLVVDAPHPVEASVLPQADTCVAVMAPAVPQAHRTAALLEAWPELDWAVVVNRLGRGGETTTRQLGDIIGRRVSLELPCSPALRDREDDGRLVSLRWTRFGRAVTRLADALVTR